MSFLRYCYLSDPTCRTTCLWLSAFLRPLSVCPQSVRKTALASSGKSRRGLS